LNLSYWNISGLDSTTITSGKLEAIATVWNNSFSSAAIHTLSPPLTGEFTIVADLELVTPNSSNSADHLLYIDGTDGDAFVGLSYVGTDLNFLADINGSWDTSNFSASPYPSTVKLKIKRNSSNYLTLIIEHPTQGELYNFNSSNFTGNIIDVRLVNFDNGSIKSIPAKWDYITVQDREQ